MTVDKLGKTCMKIMESCNSILCLSLIGWYKICMKIMESCNTSQIRQKHLSGKTCMKIMESCNSILCLSLIGWYKICTEIMESCNISAIVAITVRVKHVWK